MPATDVTPLGASTVNRKWRIDVDTNNGVGTANWVPIGGVNNLTPNFDNANLEDDSDFDSGGFQSQTKTAAAWSAQFNAARKVLDDDSTAYDPGQEHLRLRSIGKFGVANSVFVRIYEMEPDGPRVEAYTGRAAVSWQDQGGAMSGLSMVQVTLTGQGELAAIAHPDTGVAVPTISSITPSTGIAAAGGDTLVIRGNHFTGTISVTVGGTAMTDFQVVSDGMIAATSPAKTAGSYNVVVTNAAGASANFSVTYV